MGTLDNKLVIKISCPQTLWYCYCTWTGLLLAFTVWAQNIQAKTHALSETASFHCKFVSLPVKNRSVISSSLLDLRQLRQNRMAGFGCFGAQWRI